VDVGFKLSAGLRLAMSASSFGSTAHAVTTEAPRRPKGAGGVEELTLGASVFDPFHQGGWVHGAISLFVAPHTLVLQVKSSMTRAILWLSCVPTDHLWIDDLMPEKQLWSASIRLRIWNSEVRILPPRQPVRSLDFS
jgi:hypothetical protein